MRFSDGARYGFLPRSSAGILFYRRTKKALNRQKCYAVRGFEAHKMTTILLILVICGLIGFFILWGVFDAMRGMNGDK